ncbi:hypothetical protein LguiB_018430 [Lonicera macranthoides]
MRDGERLTKKGNRVYMQQTDQVKSRKVIFDIEVMASQFTSRMTRCMFHLAKGEFSDSPWLELRGRGRGLEPVISSIEGPMSGSTLLNLSLLTSDMRVPFELQLDPNFRGRPCVACAHSHKRCPLSCDYARIFPNVIDREDYHTIFTVFGVRNVASFLQCVPEDRLFEAISSYLLEATARIENPVRGCTALLASFEQKVEELQARVTALEARLGGGSSCVNPLCSFAPPGDSSRFFSSVENNVPNVIPTAVNLSEPIAGGFLRLLMSEEGVQNILSTSTNLVENGAPLTEVDLSSFPNQSYDQATLDAIYQGASNSFLSQSALDDFVVDFAETTGLDWTASGNIHHDFSDYSSFDLSTGFLKSWSLTSGAAVDDHSQPGECAGSSTQIYKIEKAKTGRGLVHIKCWYNNKYLVRWSPNHYWIAATADKPEEDKCKWSCTLFEILPIDGQTIRFRHVQLGHYACLSRLGCHNVYDSCLFAGGKGLDKDKCDVFTIYVGHILKDGTHSGVNPCKFKYETKEEKLAAASNLIEQLATEAI